MCALNVFHFILFVRLPARTHKHMRVHFLFQFVDRSVSCIFFVGVVGECMHFQFSLSGGEICIIYRSIATFNNLILSLSGFFLGGLSITHFLIDIET